jgi:hypothetical protein
MTVTVTSDVSKRFRGNAILILDILSKQLIYNYKYGDFLEIGNGGRPLVRARSALLESWLHMRLLAHR